MTPIKQARERRKLTIDQVAERTGLSKASVSRIERNKQGVSASTAARLAKVLRISENKVLYPERYPVSRKKAA